MRRINENTYKDDSEKNRDKNIVELYGIQQSFNNTLDMDELDIAMDIFVLSAQIAHSET